MTIAFFVAYSPDADQDPNQVIKRIETFVTEEGSLREKLPEEITKRESTLAMLEKQYQEAIEVWKNYTNSANNQKVKELASAVKKAQAALEESKQALRDKDEAAPPLFQYGFKHQKNEEKRKAKESEKINTYLAKLDTRPQFLHGRLCTLLGGCTPTVKKAAGQAVIAAIQDKISLEQLESDHRKPLSQGRLGTLFAEVKGGIQRCQANSPAVDLDSDEMTPYTYPLPPPYL